MGSMTTSFKRAAAGFALAVAAVGVHAGYEEVPEPKVVYDCDNPRDVRMEENCAAGKRAMDELKDNIITVGTWGVGGTLLFSTLCIGVAVGARKFEKAQRRRERVRQRKCDYSPK